MRKFRSSYVFSFWAIALLLLIFLFFIFLGIWNDAMFGRPFDPAFLALGIIPAGFAILLISFYPMIVITEEGIFKKRLWMGKGVRWDSIKEIELLGCATGFVLGDYEGTLIHPEIGRPFNINMDRYRNRSALRQIIFIADKLRVEHKPFNQLFSAWEAYDFNSGPVRQQKKLGDAGSLRFAGNPWLTLNAFLMVGLAVLSAFMIVKGIQRNYGWERYIPVIALLIVIMVMGQQFCFFKADDQQLAIKNYLWPSPLQNFQWQEIRSVMMMTLQKRSTTLIIVTRDFSSFRFGAASLKTENWDEFEEFIRKMDVPVQRF